MFQLRMDSLNATNQMQTLDLDHLQEKRVFTFFKIFFIDNV
jgi:hypothetical protein